MLCFYKIGRKAVISSASSAVTYTFVYTDSEPGRTHDPDYVPEPMYHEYIPLEDEHVLPSEEQPLPHVDSPTAESPGYVAGSDPKEDPEEYEDDESEDGPVDYPMDGGDDKYDDNGDSFGDGANDEDEEEEEHLASADAAIIVPTVEHDHCPDSGFHIPSTRGRARETSSHAYSTTITNYLAITTLCRERLARCTTPSAHSSPPPVPSPSLPSYGCPTQIQ
nr:hypothetical protein [Tanacetum cinerariifolium]